MRQMCTGAGLAVALSCLAPVVQAQGDSGALNAATTNRVVDTIAAMFDACTKVAPAYLPDCLGKAMQSGASKISNNPAYWEAHVALTRLSRGLENAVRAHRDDDTGKVRAGGYRLSAVMLDALPGISAQTKQDIARANDDFTRLSSYEKQSFAPLIDLIVTRRPWP